MKIKSKFSHIVVLVCCLCGDDLSGYAQDIMVSIAHFERKTYIDPLGMKLSFYFHEVDYLYLLPREERERGRERVREREGKKIRFVYQDID